MRQAIAHRFCRWLMPSGVTASFDKGAVIPERIADEVVEAGYAEWVEPPAAQPEPEPVPPEAPAEVSPEPLVDIPAKKATKREVE